MNKMQFLIQGARVSLCLSFQAILIAIENAPQRTIIHIMFRELRFQTKRIKILFGFKD